jgi:hexulose-6-phosphate isomerase
LDSSLFGINYDIGNSAALGFNPQEEFAAYGARIVNVHIKDRMLGGTTVPLGTGSANFDAVFEALAKVNYRGNFILQTARAVDGNHSSSLSTYRDMAVNWLKRYAI